MSTTPTKAVITTSMTVLCTRFGWTKDNKKLVIFEELTEDGSPVSPTSEFAVISKQFKEMYPGNVYLIRTTAERTSFGLSPKWLRKCADEELCRVMQAAALAFEQNSKEVLLVKRQNTLLSSLSPSINLLRAAYKTLYGFDKAGFEVWLLNELRRN